jgi:hypothetical protein
MIREDLPMLNTHSKTNIPLGFETWFPIALLLSVVGWHTWLVRTADLATPSGGGFAMFSSVDDVQQRHLDVQVHTRSVWVETRLPREMDALVIRARAVPSDVNLRAVAEAVRRASWTLTSPNSATVTRDLRGTRLEVGRVRVVLYKTRFEASPPTVSMRVIRTVEFQ